MEIEFRYADIEFRQDDNGLGTVVGTVIRYGDRAKIGTYVTEEFAPGSLTKALTSDLIFANRMHQPGQLLGRVGRGLRLNDSEERLDFELDLPDTQTGRDTAYELRTGILTGASIEFGASQVEYKGSHRIIREARLRPTGGFAIVNDAAYPDSFATMKRWAEADGAYAMSRILDDAERGTLVRNADGTYSHPNGPKPEPEPEPVPVTDRTDRFFPTQV